MTRALGVLSQDAPPAPRRTPASTHKTDDGNSVYDRCYGWREDAESLNNTLDRTLYGGRMTAHTATRQHGVMIGFALGRNAIVALIHRRHQQSAAT